MIFNNLQLCQHYLMKMGFPYHSVSVIHRHQDLGYHVIFTSKVKDDITDQVKRAIENLGFTYSIVETTE